MTKAFCLLNFIFQEPYIIWSWLMLQICNRIISPGVFLHFFQILIFGVRCGENGLKWEKIVCASTPYLSKNTSYDCVFCYTSLKCYLQMIFSFFKCFGFLVCYGWGWWGGQKMTRNNKKNKTSYLRNCTSYDCGLLYTYANWYLQQIFWLFQVWFFWFFKVHQ